MENEIPEKIDYDYPEEKPSKNTSLYPLIAGILLIIAFVISIIFWLPTIFIDASLLENMVDLSQFQQIDPSFTIEDVKNLITTCALIEIVLSVFPLLAGVLSIGKKLWGIALACSILGLLTIFGSIPSLIAMILLIVARKEFK